SVIAEIDREGDREIYVVDKDGDRQLITNNSYDDFAPVLDESEGVLVWHSMIRDRLQVMYHDLETGETKQLTSGTENNSNPHIFGDRVVWQGWVVNNWEIFMADDVDDEDFEVTKLTENSVH